MSSGDKKGPCFLSRELSPLVFVWPLQASTYGNNMGFCTAPRSLDGQKWSRREGGDCRPCYLDNLQLNAQQQEEHSPQFGGAAPRRSLHGTIPWGSPPHALATAACPEGCWGWGVQQKPESRVALPRLCSISHCRGWTPSPLRPPPLGCISAHFGAVIPACCTAKRERGRP